MQTDADAMDVVVERVEPLPLARRPQPGLPTRTLADLIAEVILGGKSPKTRMAYRSDLDDFLAWLLGWAVNLPADPQHLRNDAQLATAVNAALQRLLTVTEGDIKRYLDTLRQHATPRSKRSPQLSEATINRRLTPLRRLFGRLQRYGMITINPMDDIKPANLGTISATVYLTRSQARRLLDTCVEPPITLREQRDHAIMALMLKTGLRSSEVLGLQVADLAVVEGHAVAWVTRKGQKRGRIKLGRAVRQLIQVYLDAAGITRGPIFRRLIAAKQPRRRLTPGEPRERRAKQYQVGERLAYVGLRYLLKQRFKEAGLSELLSPHSLRHSFITLALRGGAKLVQVQHAAGHSNPATTMRYAHGLDDLDDNATDYVEL